MHIAQVSEWGKAPKYVEVDTPPMPTPESGLVQIKVAATGLHQLVRSRAAGSHYSSAGLPHYPGVDGVGTTPDGQIVYFLVFQTGGSFSEIINVPKQSIMPLPTGLDPLQAAAFTNPALSSWLALNARTDHLPKDFSILIMGATSASGSMAIPLSRALGAKKVIGVARNTDTLSTLGLDDTIILKDPVEETDFSKANDVDVIIDYLYGPPAEHLLQTLNPTRPVQYIHIGALAGLDITLPGAVLRSKNLTIRGSGPGAWSMRAAAAQIPKMLQAMSKIEPRKVNAVPLREVEKAWDVKGDRTVFTP